MGKLSDWREQPRRISITLLIVAGVMLLDGVYQVTVHLQWRSWLPETLAREPATTQPSSATTQAAKTQATQTQATQSQPASGPATQPSSKPAPPKSAKPAKKKKPKPYAVHGAIKKRNIFAKPKPKGHGLTLTGVMGDIAMFATRSGQTVGIEVGKSGQGIKVQSIDGYEVKIEYKGKSETMKLKFGGAPSGPSGRPGRGARPSGRRGRPPGAPGAKPPGAKPPGAGPNTHRARMRRSAAATTQP